YPLLTGLAAAALGLEALGARGVAAAVGALVGLALMLGAHPAGLTVMGVVAALASACSRVAMLLITRAPLACVAARLITWYSFVISTALFSVCALIARDWHAPASAAGWMALVLLGVFATVGILAVYMSTGRIGPFRTALFMNLEPLLTAIGSAIFLGE